MGSNLFTDSGRITRRGPFANREAAREAHSTRETGAGYLRDPEPGEPRSGAPHLRPSNGRPLRLSQEERDRIAELYLIAGKRSKTSTAYASALTYFVAGAALL